MPKPSTNAPPDLLDQFTLVHRASQETFIKLQELSCWPILKKKFSMKKTPKLKRYEVIEYHLTPLLPHFANGLNCLPILPCKGRVQYLQYFQTWDIAIYWIHETLVHMMALYHSHYLMRSMSIMYCMPTAKPVVKHLSHFPICAATAVFHFRAALSLLRMWVSLLAKRGCKCSK